MNSSRSSITNHAKTLEGKVANLEDENALLMHKYDQLLQSYDSLQHQFKQFQRHRFGQRSEAYVDPNNPQGLLFGNHNDASSSSSDDKTDDKNKKKVIKIKEHEHEVKSNKQFADHLPRKEHWINVPEHLRTCACGCQKKPLNPLRHERLHYEPPIFEVIVELREQLVCPKGCKGQWVSAQKPKYILPKARFTESVLAHIIVSKLDDRQPYYHLEKQFESRAGFKFTRQTMARSTIECASSLQPLVNLLKDSIIDYSIAALDPTMLQVLKEPGRPPTRKSYLYCFRGCPPGKQAIVYGYNATDHKPYVANWFAGFKGKVHCDADPFFELLFKSDDVIPSYCNAHARRYFETIANTTTQGLSHEAMRQYNRLFRIEKLAKDKHLNADQRWVLRQAKSRPIMAELKNWLDNYYPTVLPKSPLGKAFAYALKYWTGLSEFLNDGRLEIHNNHTEQEIKPFVQARKNFLFCTSVKGAHALALHFSLIRSAKLHNLDSYRYYVEILKAIPHCHTVEDYEVLLPWNIQLAKVGELSIAA